MKKKLPEPRVPVERQVSAGPLSERMEKILVALYDGGATSTAEFGMTGNEIGMTLGFETGSDRFSKTGKVMGPANRVNFAVSALERRGLVRFAARRGGLTGGARRLTVAGEAEVRRIREVGSVGD